jgi:hypothetical protein
MSRIKLLGEATTLPGKKYITTVIGVMIERVQEKVCRFLVVGADDRSCLSCLRSRLPFLLYVSSKISIAY